VTGHGDGTLALWDRRRFVAVDLEMELTEQQVSLYVPEDADGADGVLLRTTPRHAFECVAGGHGVSSLAFGGGSGGLLATTGLDGLLRVWSFQLERSVGAGKFKLHGAETALSTPPLLFEQSTDCGVLLCCAWGGGDRFLAAAGEADEILIFSKSGDTLASFRKLVGQHVSFVSSLVFCEAAGSVLTLLSGGFDGRVQRSLVVAEGEDGGAGDSAVVLADVAGGISTKQAVVSIWLTGRTPAVMIHLRSLERHDHAMVHTIQLADQLLPTESPCK